MDAGRSVVHRGLAVLAVGALAVLLTVLAIVLFPTSQVQACTREDAETLNASSISMVTYHQLLACVFAGALVGAITRHPYTGSRAARAAEGAVIGTVAALMFMLGAGQLDEDRSDPLPVAAAAIGVLIYASTLLAISRTRFGPSGESRHEND